VSILAVLAPAVVLTGTIAGLRGTRSPLVLLAIAIAAVAVALLEVRGWRVPLLLIAAGAAGAANGATARNDVLRSPLVHWFDTRAVDGRLNGLAHVTGVLLEDAEVTQAGVRVRVRASQISMDRMAGPVRGDLVLYVGGDLAPGRAGAWTAGRTFRAPASLRRTSVTVNFGAASPVRQALGRGYLLTGTVKGADVVDVAPAGIWRERAAAIRARVRRVSARHIAGHDARAGAIVTAVLIGDRAGLDTDVERQLQAAGTYHVIAISGGNVALLTWLCHGALRLILRSPRAASAATLLLIAGYGGLVGGDPSVARAVSAAGIYLAAGIAGLAPAAFGLLRTTMVVVLAADPMMAIDPGAWLSFGATFGIVAFTRPIVDALGPWRPGAPAWPPARGALTLVFATVAAEAIVLPISAAVFGRVSLVSVAMNLVAIPAAR